MFPASTQNVDAFAVQRSRYLQETYIQKTGKRPLIPVNVTIITVYVTTTCKFLNVLNNSQRYVIYR